MIVGIGVDVVDVTRFTAVLARTPAMLGRLFTAAERADALANHSLAARFAAKEAVAKALGAPPGLSHHEAEIVKGPHGRPSLRITGHARAVADALGVATWHLTMSHDGGFAVAYVIAEGVGL